MTPTCDLSTNVKHETDGFSAALQEMRFDE